MSTPPIHLTDPDLGGGGYRHPTHRATVDPGPPRRVRPTGDLYHPILPPNTIYIGRPGPWGNKHPVGKPCKACPNPVVHDVDQALEAFRADLRNNPALVERARRILYGRNLACWCKPGAPCHGDVWLYVVAGGQP